MNAVEPYLPGRKLMARHREPPPAGAAGGDRQGRAGRPGGT
jgi:hypothetical protein